MCGRFSLYVPPAVLEARFDAEVAETYAPRYNIAPRDDVAAIRDAGPETVDSLSWGLVPGWVDDPDDYPRPINARAETVSQKPSFRDAFAERRCLVLADGFYEWKGHRGSKQPYRIARDDEEPFAFAGLWETWESNGDSLLTTTIITSEANETVGAIHDRMPVILEAGEERRWLAEEDPDVLQSMLDPYPDDDLDAYTVSKLVNDPANDSPAVVEPVDVGEQSGLSEFG